MCGPTPGTRQPGIAPQAMPSDVRADIVPGAVASDDTCKAGGSGRLRRLLLWSRLAVGFRELSGACLCHGRIRGVASRGSRPPAFFNHSTLLPYSAFLECCEFHRRISLPHESLDADRDEDSRHCYASTFGCLPLSGTAKDPSPPGKANDHDPNAPTTTPQNAGVNHGGTFMRDLLVRCVRSWI
jgi:hypothetical protein